MLNSSLVNLDGSLELPSNMVLGYTPHLLNDIVGDDLNLKDSDLGYEFRDLLASRIEKVLGRINVKKLESGGYCFVKHLGQTDSEVLTNAVTELEAQLNENFVASTSLVPRLVRPYEHFLSEAYSDLDAEFTHYHPHTITAQFEQSRVLRSALSPEAFDAFRMWHIERYGPSTMAARLQMREADKQNGFRRR